ncbi:hypothetical protein INS49_014155 [Diaporthe citri]|uniref:uncharacterized protein n=1 Tax=Diaporthe citri TaxID=83186 RepID=UPI001C7FA6EF|nr:uncharacterized protein INS49_014155 [Diaporthe citri]KAG6358271.1 hypothetical protein INS49_014155 [Diaporthe citri]
MFALPPYEEDFVYSTTLPQGTGPRRLLKFNPSTPGTKLSLSLVDAKQGDRFCAISYAWNRPVCTPRFDLNSNVFCPTHGTAPWTNSKAVCNSYLSYFKSAPNGYTDILIDENNFYVQDTVFHLLLATQKFFQNGGYFWLDSCINQNDSVERGQQTSVMHEIYKAAQHVFVWLGTAYDSSDIAMDSLYYLAPSASPYASLPHSPLRAQSHSQDISQQVCSLFDRPYWRRTWVIQEFLLARDATLLCGNRAVPYTKTESLVDQLEGDYTFRKRYPQLSATPAVKLIQARKAFMSFPVKPSLQHMVHHFLFTRSTFPEDKLIGLLRVSRSTVETGFNGESGSLEKRMEVISEFVRDYQGRAMDPKTPQQWQHLLACLLGVRGIFPEPEASLTPHLGFNPLFPPPRNCPPATSTPYPGRVVPPQGARQPPPTSIPVLVVGNVWSSKPASWLAHPVYGNGVSHMPPPPTPTTRMPRLPGFARPQ